MAELLHKRTDAVLGYEGLTADEEIRLRNDLGKFIIALVKSILQTSFYRTEHKLTVAAVDDYFKCMEPLQEFFYELTLVASPDETKPDFSVEGIMVEPIPLSACIKAVLRDEFIAKLRDFFYWNKIVSFSIKKELDREQFLVFLQITARDLEKILKEKKAIEEGEIARLKHRPLTDQLLTAGVITISAICRDDMVFIDRKLPWRVKLALTRLMKNLRDIPLYSKATNQQIGEAKAQLLQEIIRPLRGRDMLMELLLNCDLVYESNEELRGMDIEHDILIVLKRHQLRGVSERFVIDLEQNAEANEGEKVRKRKGLSLLRKCLLPLSDVLDEESLNIFRRAVKGGFLSMMELPENVQQFIRVEKMADEFLATADAQMARLEKVRDVDSFRSNASNAAMLVRELVFRKEYVWANKIVEVIHALSLRHRDPQDPMKKLSEDSLDAMSTKENFERMFETLAGLDSVQQEHLYKICGRFKTKALPLLIQQMRKDVEPTARASIRVIIESMGEKVLPTLHRAVDARKQRWEYYRDLLLVLGQIKSKESYNRCAGFLGDPTAEVRQAAFTAVTSIGEHKAESELLSGLRDPNALVRRTVVKHLGEIGSRADAYQTFLQDLFEGKLKPPLGDELRGIVTRSLDEVRLPYLQLLNSGVASINGLLEKGGINRRAFEPNLARMVRQQVQVSIFKGGEEVQMEREKLLLGMIAILNRIGSEICLPALNTAKKSGSQEVLDLASSSIREIKHRDNIGYKEPLMERVIRFVKQLMGKK